MFFLFIYNEQQISINHALRKQNFPLVGEKISAK